MKNLKAEFAGAVLENAEGVNAGDICALKPYDEEYHLVENRNGDFVKIPQDYVIFLGEIHSPTEDEVIISAIIHGAVFEWEGQGIVEAIAMILEEEVSIGLTKKVADIAQIVEDGLDGREGGAELGMEYGIIIDEWQSLDFGTEVGVIEAREGDTELLVETEDGSRVWIPESSVCFVGEEDAIENELTVISSVIDHAEANDWPEKRLMEVVNKLLDDMDPALAAEIMKGLMGY